MGTSVGANLGANYVQTAQYASGLAKSADQLTGAGDFASAAQATEGSAYYDDVAACQAHNGGNDGAAQTLEAKAGTNYAIGASKYFNAAHQFAEKGDMADADAFMAKAKQDSALSVETFQRAASLGGPMAGAMVQMYGDARVMASQTQSLAVPPSASYSQAGMNMNAIMQQVKALQPAMPEAGGLPA